MKIEKIQNGYRIANDSTHYLTIKKPNDIKHLERESLLKLFKEVEKLGKEKKVRVYGKKQFKDKINRINNSLLNEYYHALNSLYLNFERVIEGLPTNELDSQNESDKALVQMFFDRKNKIHEYCKISRSYNNEYSNFLDANELYKVLKENKQDLLKDEGIKGLGLVRINL